MEHADLLSPVVDLDHDVRGPVQRITIDVDEEGEIRHYYTHVENMKDLVIISDRGQRKKMSLTPQSWLKLETARLLFPSTSMQLKKLPFEADEDEFIDYLCRMLISTTVKEVMWNGTKIPIEWREYKLHTVHETFDKCEV